MSDDRDDHIRQQRMIAFYAAVAVQFSRLNDYLTELADRQTHYVGSPPIGLTRGEWHQAGQAGLFLNEIENLIRETRAKHATLLSDAAGAVEDLRELLAQVPRPTTPRLVEPDA